MAHHAVQRSINEDSEDGGIPPKGMGTFFAHKEKPRTIQRQGPVFVNKSLNDPTYVQKISDIQESAGLTKRILETLDARRLSGLVAQEAIRIGNLHPKKRTESDTMNLRRALYALDSNKYRFLSPENETPHIPTPHVIKSSSLEVSPSPKKEVNIDTPKKSDPKVHRPRKMALRLVEKDLDSLLVAPPPVKKPEPEHPLYSRVRPQIQEVSPSLPRKTVKIIEEPRAKTTEEEVISVAPHISLEKEKAFKLQAVTSLITTLYGDIRDPADIAAPLKGMIAKDATTLEKILSSGLPVVETISWRDTLDDETKIFSKDIMTLTEKNLLIKYIGLDGSASNASLLSDISNADTFDVLHNPDKFYEKREEISKLIVVMKKLASSASVSTPINELSGLSIHMMYDQVKAAVASADSREQK